MYEPKDVYSIFRREQASFYNRPYNLPKDWDSFWNGKKLNSRSKSLIKELTHRFNTNWNNIDPVEYIRCGFDLFKNRFTYIKFIDRKILNLYIERDKNKKRKLESSKKEIAENAKFIISFLKDKINPKFSVLNQYAKMKDGRETVCIKHYKQDKIGAYLIAWMIFNGYLSLDKNDISTIPNIVENLRLIINKIKNGDINLFLKKVEKVIDIQIKQS